MSKEGKLLVYLSGHLAAQIDHVSRRSWALKYEPEYAVSALPPLSVSLPKQEQPHTGERIGYWLRSHLPDDQRMLTRYAETANIVHDDTVGLLSTELGADCAGAIQFCAPGNSWSLLERPLELEHLSETTMLAELESVLAESDKLQASALYCSLAGFHRKLALRWHQGCWFKPRGAAPSTHILKPRHQEAKVVPVTEYLMLAVARSMGLDVPKAWLEQHGKVTVLVVERYDRQQTESTVYTRVHQEDMCQAFGLPPSAKTEPHGGPSVSGIADLLSRVSLSPRTCISKFGYGLLFAWLTVNIDAHARNYSLIYRGTRPELAPLYDLNTSLPFERQAPENLTLAMGYGGSLQVSEMDAKPPFHSLARLLGTESGWVVDASRDLGLRFQDQLSDIMNSLDKVYTQGLRNEMKSLAKHSKERATLFQSF